MSRTCMNLHREGARRTADTAESIGERPNTPPPTQGWLVEH